MAVKHVKEYYEKICNQYTKMKKEVQLWEEQAIQKMVDPDRVQALREMVAPLQENYKRWSYMMFLLNQPTRKEKKKKYDKLISNQATKLGKENSVDAIINESENILKNIEEDRDSL